MEKDAKMIIGKMQQIIEGVDYQIPKGWGCAVLVFPYNAENGICLYGATAERDDVVKVMEEFIEESEDNWGTDIIDLD